MYGLLCGLMRIALLCFTLLLSLILGGVTTYADAIGNPTMDDIATLEMAAKAAYESEDMRAWARHQAVLLLIRGAHPLDVAAELDVGISSVYQWGKAYREGGVAALAPHRAQRPEHYCIGCKQQQRIKQILDLYHKGLKWSAIASRLGYKNASGPWRLARRAVEKIEPADAVED